MCKCKDKPYDPAMARMVGNILAGYKHEGVHFLEEPEPYQKKLEGIAIAAARRVVKALSDGQ